MKLILGAGQAYVALSRATSLEGLQVLNFDAAKVRQLCLFPFCSFVNLARGLGDGPSSCRRMERDAGDYGRGVNRPLRLYQHTPSLG